MRRMIPLTTLVCSLVFLPQASAEDPLCFCPTQPPVTLPDPCMDLAVDICTSCGVTSEGCRLVATFPVAQRVAHRTGQIPKAAELGKECRNMTKMLREANNSSRMCAIANHAARK